MQSDGNGDNSQGKCHFEGFVLIRDIFLRTYRRVFRWYFRSASVRYLLAKVLMKPVES